MTWFNFAKETATKRLIEVAIALGILGLVTFYYWYSDGLAKWLALTLAPIVLAKILLVLLPLLVGLIAYCFYLRPRHEYFAELGIYKNKKGIGYCNRCYSEKSKWVPLREDAFGFTCAACGRWYKKPEPPELDGPKPKKPKSGASWMAR